MLTAGLSLPGKESELANSVTIETCNAEALGNYRAELGEGPMYDPDLDAVFWFDIVKNRLLECNLSTRHSTEHPLPFMASMIARTSGRQHIIAAEDGIYRWNYETGALDLYKSLEADNSITRSNDGRVHPSGALWIGTMGKLAEKHAGSIYWLHRGQLERLYSNITIPNSICFSPAGDLAFYTDTAAGILFKVEVDPTNGYPTEAPTPIYDHGDTNRWP